jgi:hypothetical protein
MILNDPRRYKIKYNTDNQRDSTDMVENVIEEHEVTTKTNKTTGLHVIEER